MPVIKTYPMQNSAILRLYSEKLYINTEPEYQRQGGVWTDEKRQLLIDSILNDFDIPKLYFHSISKKLSASSEVQQDQYDFAIIDGRQRIETIWHFMEDEFPLSNDFVYLADEKVKAGGLKYTDLASAYPKLKIRFDSFTLPIMCVETDDLDLIEDMFSRLNEAVPLNAAEKRNALGGPMAAVIKRVSEHPFFATRVRFPNKRYQHREVAAKLLFIEYSLRVQKRIIDTKKPYLDDMVDKFRTNPPPPFLATDLETITSPVLDILESIFSPGDPLLKAQSPITIFYLLARLAEESNALHMIDGKILLQFHQELEDNRRRAEQNIAEANFDLLEFDRMSQQGTNDASSIRERVRILKEYVGIPKPKSGKKITLAKLVC
jgi:Protein of unknown function DUF262